MGELLTRRELAARLGVSRQRVEKLINQGRLLERDGLIDFDHARAVWEGMRPDYRSRSKVLSGQQDGGTESGAAPNVVSLEDQRLFNQARARREMLKAQTAELEYKRLAGRLVERERVQAESYAAARLLDQKLSQIPRQIGPQCAVITDPSECEQLIADAINGALEEFKNALAAL